MSEDAKKLRAAIDAYRVVHGTTRAADGEAALRATVGDIQQRQRCGATTNRRA